MPLRPFSEQFLADSSPDEADRSLPCIYREAADQPGPEMNSISNISQFSVTLPLDCHSDQVSVNGCHSDHFRSHFSQIHLRGRLIGRFPIYREATDQPGPEMNSISNISQSSVTLPLQSHCATRLKLTVKKSFKNAPLAGFQDRKGTPFEHFRRVLSTNQKPGFRALDQSEASISAKFSASAKFEPTQCTATVPLQSHCVTEDPLEPNLVPMDIQICQWTANSPMPCHLNHSCVTPTTGMPLKERVISRDPVSIVQLHLGMRLIGRFPVYTGKRPISRVPR